MLGWGKKDFMIEVASDGDLKDIERIHAASFPRGWSQSELLDMHNNDGTLVLVARPVGMKNVRVAGFNIFRQTQIEAEIISVAVDPKWRRQGIGDLLMRDAMRRLSGNRIPALFLEVSEANHHAIALYRRLGFATVGTRPAYYREGAEEDGKPAAALVMRAALD